MKYPETAMRLRKAMEAKNLTPQELSNKSGVSKGSISLYLSGQNEPRTRNAGKMAEVLGVTPMYLMGFDIEVIEETDINMRINNTMSKMNQKQLERLLLYAKFLTSEMGGDE